MCSKKIFKAGPLGKALGLDDVFNAPEAPRAPPSAPDAPTAADPSVQQARDDERRRRAAAAGQQSTILTGAGGLSAPASTGQKTLLGS